MDGINGFVLTYYLIVSVVLLNLGAKELFFFNYNNLKFIIILIILLYFLNIFNFLYLGDGGAYLLGFIFSVELIFFYNTHENISPFFIILLLWYPAFESLFSILRKFNLKKSPMLPDTNHLHQLIYYYFIKKIKLNSIFFNNLTALAINFYNAIIIYLSFLKISNNQFQLFLIFLNILFYIFFYIRLIKIKKL
jgi:UDP-N-acetylmuramyl pentapeptide phosphotransferase/UDP-N-acetylglucosamine-1-phosphate transferase